MFYLLNLSLSGVKNIAREITFNFYPKRIDKKFDPEDYKVKGIFGENGSGKTAIITAVSLCKKIVTVPHYLDQRDTQTLLRELINKTTQKAEIKFEFLFKTEPKDKDTGDIVVFTYAVTLESVDNVFKITHEKLDQKNGNTITNKYHNLFETENGKIKHLKADEKSRKTILNATMNLLDKESFISLFTSSHSMLKFSSFVLNIVLTYIFFISLYTYLEEEDQHETFLMQSRIDFLNQDDIDMEEKFNRLKSIQSEYTVIYGRSRIRKEEFQAYEAELHRLEKFIRLFKKNLKGIDIDKREDGDFYICDLLMNYGQYRISLEFESTGIRKLARIYEALSAADRGYIAFVDEMDANINSIYLARLVEYYTKYSSGQLIFTSHNLEPMDALNINKCSIDFLSSDNEVVSWIQKGNASPAGYYRNGMIKHQPFNLEAEDFIGVFGE